MGARKAEEKSMTESSRHSVPASFLHENSGHSPQHSPFFFFCSRKSGSLIFYVNSHNFYILVFKKKKKKTTMWPNEIPLQSGSGSWAASEELSLIFLIWSIWIHFSDFPRWAGYISGTRFEPQCYRGNSISKSCYNGSTQLQKSTLLRAIGMISRTLLQEHMHKF